MNISIFLISTIACYYPSHFNLQEMFPFDSDDPCAFDIKSEGLCLANTIILTDIIEDITCKQNKTLILSPQTLINCILQEYDICQHFSIDHFEQIKQYLSKRGIFDLKCQPYISNFQIKQQSCSDFCDDQTLGIRSKIILEKIENQQEIMDYLMKQQFPLLALKKYSNIDLQDDFIRMFKLVGWQTLNSETYFILADSIGENSENQGYSLVSFQNLFQVYSVNL